MKPGTLGDIVDALRVHSNLEQNQFMKKNKSKKIKRDQFLKILAADLASLFAFLGMIGMVLDNELIIHNIYIEVINSILVYSNYMQLYTLLKIINRTQLARLSSKA